MPKKSGTIIKEVGIIVILIVVAVIELQYFKIIDLSAFFQVKPSDQTQISQNLDLKKPFAPTPSVKADNRLKEYIKTQQDLELVKKNGALHYAFLSVEYEGRVMSIDVAGGIDKKNNIAYKVHVVIDVGKGKDLIDVFYPEKSLSKVKILDSKKKTLTFTDLKTGDLVKVKINTGILRQYPDNLNESFITKLN